MSGAKNHDYHILEPSFWPLMGAFSALAMASGGIMWMHKAAWGAEIFGLGLAGVLATMYFWWADVVREANQGDHTPVVQLHLRYGMILFIASEVMFFVGWFWAFSTFHCSRRISPGMSRRIRQRSLPIRRRWSDNGRPRASRFWTHSTSPCSTP